MKIVITDAAGTQVAEMDGGKAAGLNVVTWNGRARGRVAREGDYRVTLKVGPKEFITMVSVENVSAQLTAPLRPDERE